MEPRKFVLPSGRVIVEGDRQILSSTEHEYIERLKWEAEQAANCDSARVDKAPEE
jgi:hypothetical protein